MTRGIPQKPSKRFVLRAIEAFVRDRPDATVLELGCGQARHFLPILGRYPALTYVGVDPKPAETKIAGELLRDHPRARVVTMLGYEGLPELDGKCDVVVSLSVLEHVKDLRRFLRFSADKARPDGRIVHLYDLGHALYPGSIRERLRVAASTCRLTRPFVPETRFAAYVDRQSAESWLREAGVAVERVTYHNMPGHVRLLKTLSPSPEGERLLDAIADLEVCAAAQLAQAGPGQLEALFPSACLWGRRVGLATGVP